MDEAVLDLYAWNLRFAAALVEDLDPESAATPGGAGLENHPAWTLGHLVTGANLLAVDLGLPDDLPEGWRDRFERRGPGDPRRPEAGTYPPLETLLGELRRQHARVAEAWRRRSPAEWARREDWAFGRDLPTSAGASLFMAISHESMHLGQLSAWRRARGLPSALGALARAGA